MVVQRFEEYMVQISRYHPLLVPTLQMVFHRKSQCSSKSRQYESEARLDPAYIIIYTADLTDEATETLMAAGADEVMPKPPPKGYVAKTLTRIIVSSEKGPVK